MANDTKGKRPAQAAHEQLTAAQKRSREEEDEKWARFLAMRDGAQPPPDPAPAAPSPAPAPAPVSPRALRAQRPVNIANPGGTSSTVYTPPFAERAPALAEPEFAPLAGEPLHESGRGPATGSSARKWFTLADTFTPRAPVRYVIDTILPEGSLSMLYGAPGSLKSMLALDMLVCIAAGKPWLSPSQNGEGQGMATERSAVLFVDFDSGKRIVMERMEAVARGHGITDPARLPFYAESMELPWLLAPERSSVEAFARDMRAQSVRACVIDNFGVITGGVDENSSEMATVMGNLRWLAESTGAAVVVIHHPRKGDTKGNSNAGDSLRGHGSILAALDLALLVEREQGSRIVAVRSVKARSVPVAPFVANWTYTHKAGTKELATGQFYGMGEDTDSRSDGSITRAIVAAVTGKPMNQSQLVDEVCKLTGAGKVKVRGLVILAAEEGHITASPRGENGARIYQAG